VNNYLLGNDLPAFDVLFWNADSTRLPAGLHCGFLDIFETNPLPKAGAISVLGTPIELRRVTVPTYVLGALTDHIVPWQAAYGITQMLGGPSHFVLSSSGHIQSIVNPPGNPKASYYVDGRTPRTPQRGSRTRPRFAEAGGSTGHPGSPSVPVPSGRRPNASGARPIPSSIPRPGVTSSKSRRGGL
jgi:polyhydroxyalkanoate synthase